MSWEEAFRVSAAVIASLGGGGAIVWGLSSYLGKLWAAKILEREKLELDKLRKEHEIRFSKLHVERAEAIKELARLLQELHDSMHSFLKDFQPVDEPDLEQKVSQSRTIHNAFVSIFKKNKVFFSKDTASLIHQIALCSRDTYVDVTTYPVSTGDQQYQLIPELLTDRNDCWKEARQRFDNDLTNLISKLEAQFRKMLGID